MDDKIQSLGGLAQNQREGIKKLRYFGIELIANSYGTRDKERLLKSDESRIVILGVSFVEGFGVEASKRFTDKLEELTNRSFLNFGTSWDFGPLQYNILCTELASQFDHDGVLVSILPVKSENSNSVNPASIRIVTKSYLNE